MEISSLAARPPGPEPSLRESEGSQMTALVSSEVVNVEDLRRLARRRLPRAVFDYLDGGAETETSLRGNCRAFESLTFRPRNAIAVPHCDLRTKVLGAELSFPAILAPIGYSRLIHPQGECAASQGA